MIKILYNTYIQLMMLIILISTTVSADTISLYIENDYPLNTDTDYTHGTDITYMTNEKLWNFDDVGIGIMQLMYAPEDIEIVELQTDDRPYCGILGVNLIGKKYYAHYVDEFQITLGVIGKYSYTEQAQRIVHKIVGCAEPEGWDNQLSTEAIVNAEYTRTHDIHFKLCDSLYFDIEPGFDLQVGNWNDGAEFSVDFRLGNTVSPLLNHGITQRDLTLPRLKYWLLIGGSCKNVWHATQLDGSIFGTTDYHVKSENFVYELRVGFGFGSDSFDLQFMNICKTREYTIEDNYPAFVVLIGTWHF